MSAERPPWLAVAGEASGDRLLSAVIDEGRRRGVEVPWLGVGGEASAASGLECLAHIRDLTAHGLGDALHTVPALLRTWRRLTPQLHHARGALLVDFPELNRRLLRRAHALGVPVAWLSPPQAWAWRPWRARDVSLARWVGCLMPFEAAWYRAHGVSAVWVGHPLAERPAPPMPTTPAVCLLPGSRDSSVARLLPLMLGAAARVHRAAPEVRFHLPVAPTVSRMGVARAVQASGLPVRLWSSSGAALAASTVALAGAGTACLESTLAGRPTVICALLPPMAAKVARALVRVPHVALPNLILGRAACPELILEACTPTRMSGEVLALLAHPPRALEAVAELREVMDNPGFAGRVLEGLAEVSGVGLSSAPSSATEWPCSTPPPSSSSPHTMSGRTCPRS